MKKPDSEDSERRNPKPGCGNGFKVKVEPISGGALDVHRQISLSSIIH